jgi:plastocyanin
MRLRRRTFLAGAAAALALPARADGPVDIALQGDPGGAHVWFDPAGLLVRPGTTVRWTNRDPGNAHTSTAYHPANFDRPRRIPPTARPWNSDYLMPGEAFEIMLTAPGVYDFYCIPHEHAGMVGRIVVGAVPADWRGWPDGDLPAAALAGFPDARTIVAEGAVRAAGRPA